ncbi:MAG: DNA topology modulation protein FlaR [Clostridiales bacterium]|nr:DNA topology modulation protein FlaR [Clostridiales bacterium]
MKIAIIGYSGSGKSTLAKRLAKELGIEPLYLDRVHFLPGWVERDHESAREIVRKEMLKPDWVIDGNYTHMHREERLREADEIIFLNYPRISCLLRALKRYRDFRGDSRDSIANGCIERMNWEFAWWVLCKGRTKARKCAFRDIVRRYPHKTAVIKNDHELEHYLQTRLQNTKAN